MSDKVIKALSIAGFLLTTAGGVLSGYAGKKQQDATIAKQLAEALANQAK